MCRAGKNANYYKKVFEMEKKPWTDRARKAGSKTLKATGSMFPNMAG